MFALAADFDPVGARTDRFGHRGFRVELHAQLIEVGDLQVGAELHGARVGLERPSMSRMRVDLPAPFGPMSPMRSPRMIRADRFLTTVAVAEALVDIGELGNECAGALAGVETDFDIAESVEPVGALGTQSARGA